MIKIKEGKNIRTLLNNFFKKGIFEQINSEVCRRASAAAKLASEWVFINSHRCLTRRLCSSLWSSSAAVRSDSTSKCEGNQSSKCEIFMKVFHRRTGRLVSAVGGGGICFCLGGSMEEHWERQFIKNYWDILTSDIKSLSRAQTSSIGGLNRSHTSAAT